MLGCSSPRSGVSGDTKPKEPEAARREDDETGKAAETEREEWLRHKKEDEPRERARLEQEARVIEADESRRREAEEQQRREDEAREREQKRLLAAEEAQRHLDLLREEWDRREKAARPTNAQMNELREAYLRYIDMHAAGLTDRDEYRILRARLDRLTAMFFEQSGECLTPSTVQLALWRLHGPATVSEVDVVVEQAEKEAEARRPAVEAKGKKALEEFARHFDDPKAPVTDDLRELLDALERGPAPAD